MIQIISNSIQRARKKKKQLIVSIILIFIILFGYILLKSNQKTVNPDPSITPIAEPLVDIWSFMHLLTFIAGYFILDAFCSNKIFKIIIIMISAFSIEIKEYFDWPTYWEISIWNNSVDLVFDFLGGVIGWVLSKILDS